MPSTRLASVLAALLALALPAAAAAKPWQGVEPGRSTADEVVTKLGEPTSRVKRGVRTVVAYKGDQALAGTREAQFHCRADGVVEEITVFLAVPLDADSIEGTYGKPQTKTFTDSFQKVWLYPQKGVTVFFDKEGAVEAIAFSAPAAAKAERAAPAAPAADHKADPRAEK
jgi:hypothetical protein